ncbi:MAG: hypothetical protein QOE69_3441, partial [Thermoleophilaceae bacterium]|nr:hypothetical protein [Thermoleophilaceae bacterium]
ALALASVVWIRSWSITSRQRFIPSDLRCEALRESFPFCLRWRISPDESALHIRPVGALAVADGVISYDGLRFVPDEYFDDAGTDQQALKQSYSRLASEVDFEVLLTAHGEPLATGARERLREFASA